MRRLGVLIAAVMVGLLLVSSTALAAPKNVIAMELECESGTYQVVWNAKSWTFHSLEGTPRFIAHKVILRGAIPIFDEEDELIGFDDLTFVDRAHGVPLEYCSTICPFTGLPTDMWGILTPVRGR